MSSSPEPRPIHLYKILSSHPIEPFPIEYPLSALDAKDGFVHLSTAMQVIQIFFFLAAELPLDSAGFNSPGIENLGS